MAEASKVVFFRKSSETAAAPKYAAGAPNIRSVRDVCLGICRALTEHAPAKQGEALPRVLERELIAVVRREVGGVQDVSVIALREVWSVSFTTADDATTYDFAFTVEAPWVNLER